MTRIASIPEAGDTIEERYLLIQRIGRGGFGVVFKAYDHEENQRLVALKMLVPEALVHDDVPKRFVREARLMSSFSHPNLAQVYNTGLHYHADRTVPLPFMTLEYLEGEPLSDRLTRVGKMTLDETLYILEQVLACLGAAHDLGIIHRDLKPSNIFLCKTDDEDKPLVKVLDFGIARAVGGDWGSDTLKRLTKTGMVTGTPKYMAPEQIAGESNVSPALDVYALGCLTYRMLSGKAPYTGITPMQTTLKHLSDPIPVLDAPQTEDIAHVVAQAMAKKPKDRFEDAAAFGRALFWQDPPTDEEGATLLMNQAMMFDDTLAMEAVSLDPDTLPDSEAVAISPPPTGERRSESPPADKAGLSQTHFVVLMIIMMFIGIALGALIMYLAR